MTAEGQHVYTRHVPAAYPPRLFAGTEPTVARIAATAWCSRARNVARRGLEQCSGMLDLARSCALRGVPHLHLGSVWADAARLVLSPCRVDDPSNASTAIPALLEDAGARGRHRAHRRHGLPEADGADDPRSGRGLCIGFKGNQPQLHEAVVETFAVE